jgi:transcription antitermination factor NusG
MIFLLEESREVVTIRLDSRKSCDLWRHGARGFVLSRVGDARGTSLRARPSSRWFALQIQTNRASRIQRWIRELGIETYAAFSGYLFLRLAGRGELIAVLGLPGVARALPTSLEPIPIPDEEISALRRVLESNVSASPCGYLAGERVTIRSGPLSGVAGIVVDVRASNARTTRVQVGVEMLGRAVSVEIEPEHLEKV